MAELQKLREAHKEAQATIAGVESINKEVEDSTDDVDMGELSRMLSMGGNFVP